MRPPRSALPADVRAHPRAVVIGAGHNGLVCAIRLARAGVEVCVLDGAQQPGGAVSSFEAPAGFVHDACSGFFPMARASPALRDLPLERHGLEWIVPDTAMVHPFLDGGELVLHRDLEQTARSLDALAPGAGTAWSDMAGPLLAHGDLLARTVFARFPPLRAGTAAALRLHRHAIGAALRGVRSAAGLGRELSSHDARIGAWLAGSAMHSDLGPDDAGGAGLALALHLLGHMVGWPIARGGAQRLTDALVAHLRELGGEVRCGIPVERIESGDGVRGVVAGGERLAAGAVVSTVSPGPLAALLGAGALPPRVMTRLRGWRYGVGTVKVDFALGGPVPWASVAARRSGVVHLGDTLEAMRSRPPLIVGQHTVHDASRAPAGKHTLYVYCRADRVSPDEIEERIEAFAPGFRSLVETRSVRTPEAIAAENPSLVGGDLAGGSCALHQQLVFRPGPRMFRYRTPLRGLYVAGASTHPGPGVHGASGAGAADVVLADLGHKLP